ncbi:glycoside hydrolase family 3 N-terminal domain-containing protein [Desulfovibrio sp. Fe33]|uniref:glycoside hydrolase family 3 N-terminal domain-containing protein n=1 Tax=Desulfovibrio sp. Fe33 TaxID=3020842 RepID=UPI00234C769E|nr:glycoside hydrolase family 3 N-terminal domain-containing protein [Desulfovibrio sp. Fe33]
MRTFFAALTLLSILLSGPARAADLDVMIGQMLMAGFRGFTVNEDSAVIRDIRDRGLGGVILFDRDVLLGSGRRNIRSKEQVAKLIRDLQSHAEIPLFVAVDQEGGNVQRLKRGYGFLETPSAADICAAGEFNVRTAGYMVGSTLASVGFNLDFAPVVDVNVNPDSPAIGGLGRSFSGDPRQAAFCARVFMEELHRAGVLSCLKHFPGHGSAGSDSHAGLTDVTGTWSEAELIPYRELIGSGKTDMIMTAHIFNAKLDPDYPATLSKKVVTGLLREKLGFDGVVITDDMDMGAIADEYGRKEAIRRAIEAGADILLFGNNLSYDRRIAEKAHAIIHELVDGGIIPLSRIETSYNRIMRLKQSLKQ